MNELTNLIQSVPTATWAAFGTALLGSAAVSGVLQGIKHWFQLQGEKTITLLLLLLSLGVSFADYLAQGAAQDPGVLAQHTVTITGLATIIYRFVIKGIYSYFINLSNDAENYRKAAANYQLGASSAPTAPTSSETPEDFAA